MTRKSSENKQECVILLHGLARSRFAMLLMQNALQKAGYRVINMSYPSTKYVIPKLATDTINTALEACKHASKIHFVTHSMGGILLRWYLSQHTIPNLGRSVMLGPPNKGSELVDNLKSIPLFSLINGPAGLQLGAKKDSFVNQLGSVNFELGVIAGTRSLNPIYALFIPRPHDGKVSVESTKVSGMSAHITLPVSHSFMMNNHGLIKQVKHYLSQGTFI